MDKLDRLDEEDDLALCSNPEFIDAMTRLVIAMDEITIDWSQVRTVTWDEWLTEVGGA